MKLSEINFGDVDAKNEIIKQSRNDEQTFFDSYSVPKRVKLDDLLNGKRYIILGLKGTGKTALLRYLHDICRKKGFESELILFKSHISEEDRQTLSNSSGFDVITTGDAPSFVQDFKEAWKWMIYQRIAMLYKKCGENSPEAQKLYSLVGIADRSIFGSIGSLISKINSGSMKLSAEAAGIALEIGVEVEPAGKPIAISDLNRACGSLLHSIKSEKSAYIFFDELELFHQTAEQFDRDRRILRDLVYAIAQINAESAENKQNLFLLSTLRTEVLHSVLELGHEIGRDIDDFGIILDWSDGKDSKDHPLMNLISKKISASSKIPESEIWDTFFPERINNQRFYSFILNSSYYRPRDIVRLLRVARDFRDSDSKFTTEHFDKTSTEYSKQTWLEITEELLAIYTSAEILALQRFLLGWNTHFFKSDIAARLSSRYRSDNSVQGLFSKYDVSKILSDLYRIGVIGNDFVVLNPHGKRLPRRLWIFRGNTTLNDAERMSVHKSLWKHLSLVPGVA